MRLEAAKVVEVLHGEEEDQRGLFRGLVAVAGRSARTLE
jgi:hypothetical protein